MAYIAIAATPDAVSPSAAHRGDPQGASVAAIAAEAAVSSDITAALAVPAISGDTASTTAVTLIQTDFATLTTALAPATASPVLLSYDPAIVLTKNALRACLRAILRVVDGAKDLT
jgi:hypothetical protein